MIEIGKLYDLRTQVSKRGFLTVQALSKAYGGDVHCRVYEPEDKTWHGWAIVTSEAQLRKIDKPPPADGWVDMVPFGVRPDIMSRRAARDILEGPDAAEMLAEAIIAWPDRLPREALVAVRAEVLTLAWSEIDKLRTHVGALRTALALPEEEIDAFLREAEKRHLDSLISGEGYLNSSIAGGRSG